VIQAFIEKTFAISQEFYGRKTKDLRRKQQQEKGKGDGEKCIGDNGREKREKEKWGMAVGGRLE
jgi:hypothetical protein